MATPSSSRKACCGRCLARPAMVEFFVVHEAFHVLSRANPGLREELYRRSASVPAARSSSRSARAAAPHQPRCARSRHAISVRWRGRPVEVLPFVHFASEKVDPKAGFVTQMRTSWLVVERRQDGCVARDEGARGTRGPALPGRRQHRLPDPSGGDPRRQLRPPLPRHRYPGRHQDPLARNPRAHPQRLQ